MASTTRKAANQKAPRLCAGRVLFARAPDGVALGAVVRTRGTTPAWRPAA